MKYFTALPLAAALASAEMMVMDVAPAPPATGPKIHTVSTLGCLGVKLLLTRDRALSVE